VVALLVMGRRKPFQRPRQDPFSAPLIGYDVILLNQPWHELFKHKQTNCLCSSYIINLPVRPGQGPFQHPSQKTQDDFLHQTNLFDAYRVYLNIKFIKRLSTQATGVTALT